MKEVLIKFHSIIFILTRLKVENEFYFTDNTYPHFS